MLEQLQKYELYAILKKFYFSIDEIYFLNYIILPLKVHIEPKRINSIKNRPKLQFIKEGPIFIEFANFYN